MYSMFDGAFPPVAPLGFKAVAGYLGDDNFTPHVWRTAEWKSYHGLRILPIWVYNPHRNIADQAGECLERLFNFGFWSHVRRHSGVWQTPVALDLEMLVVPKVVNTFVNIMSMARRKVVVYGSAATVFKNPSGFGYWVADWTHQPHMFSSEKVVATQWTDGQTFDSSLIGWNLWKRMIAI